MRFFGFLAVALLMTWGCSAEDSVVSEKTPSPELALVAFDTPPEPIKTVEPKYPDDARRAHATGTAHVEVVIDESGIVQTTHIIRSSAHASLDEAARDAAGKWMFEPAELNEKPVVAKIVIPFEFKLQ